MKTIKLLLVLLMLSTNSIIAQNFTVNKKTIESLNKTGLNFQKIGANFIYVNLKSGELEKIVSSVRLQLLKSNKNAFIDDELPEGGYDFRFIEKHTSTIWECRTEGVFVNMKNVFNFKSENRCQDINRELVPGGDTFVPGGDTFVPGGDTFVPGGDTFSKESGSYYFLKISFKGEQETAPAILSLKVK